MVKHSEKGTVHPCPFLKDYAFIRLYYTAFALQSSRTEGVRTESKQTCKSFVVRSALAQTGLPRLQYVFSNRERVLLP